MSSIVDSIINKVNQEFKKVGDYVIKTPNVKRAGLIISMSFIAGIGVFFVVFVALRVTDIVHMPAFMPASAVSNMAMSEVTRAGIAGGITSSAVGGLLIACVIGVRRYLNDLEHQRHAVEKAREDELL
jgi:hypothetical protein